MLHPCLLQLPQALLARGANRVSLLAQQSTEHIQIPSPAPAATHNPVPSVRRHGEADNLSLEPKWLQFRVWHRTWSILVCYRCQGETTNSNLPPRPTLGGSLKAMRVGTPTSRSHRCFFDPSWFTDSYNDSWYYKGSTARVVHSLPVTLRGHHAKGCCNATKSP